MSSSHVGKPTEPNALILEAWGQGFMVGSLLIMAAMAIANMRKRILLHKVIVLELVLAMAHGTFIFPNPPAYGWYLSVTAIGLNISWALHNVVAWMKNRPFLSRRVSRIYIITVMLCWPYWVLEIYANFTYFNNINTIFLKTRPLEPLFRDPWWIFTTISLFWAIKRDYNFGLWEIIHISPRFGIMLASMILSIVFIIIDTCSVLNAFPSILPTGVEPFWKLSFVFKCLCDAIVLDDFKTALDTMRRHWMQKKGNGIFGTPNTTPANSPRRYRIRGDIESAGSPGFAYSCTATPTTPTKPGTTMHVDHIRIDEEIHVASETPKPRDEANASTEGLKRISDPRNDPSPVSSLEQIQPINEQIPNIPLRKIYIEANT
ncbi:hypothetical protein MYU51_011873 [Penicillium brevicompactum]|uniref:uncharacterized protein n=1 Tax=Penicillium brevicompactum TaxID=5074 RepID=UPI0025403BB6|nr:uncharacterized protein N7506_002323 [Penicillium brevicompactum]KAJ5349070.1 hypothetical protein N7506_002323 [Penicillium brevicompactum]